MVAIVLLSDPQLPPTSAMEGPAGEGSYAAEGELLPARGIKHTAQLSA